MYLKRISLSGFKSFVINTNIDLDKGISCLVGSNGSGKSNIIDAIRFVMGEQSVKNLRGDKSMTDLIFSGSENRKPVNVASVTLIFDNNGDFPSFKCSEIAIKRRIYRSGENEYYINNERVRLKDIYNLFADAGLYKNHFSIIGQGEVSKIISNSPMDRKIVLESAGGVHQYKDRKQETLRKLERVDDNLLRVNDILTELRNQVNPLEEQSKKAKIYLDKKEELEKLEKSLLQELIYQDSIKLKDLESQLEELKKNKDVLNIDSNNDFVKIERFKMNIRTEEDRLNNLNDEILKLNNEYNSLHTQRELLVQSLKYGVEERERVKLLEKDKLNELEYLLIKKRSYLEELNINREELKNKQISLNDKYYSVNKEYQKNNEIINTLNRNIDSYNNKIELLNNYLDKYYYKLLDNLNQAQLEYSNIVSKIFDFKDEYSIIEDIIISPINNNLICQTSNNAKKIIQYVNRLQLGRITIYPLDILKVKKSDPIPEHPGVLGRLSDLVSCDYQYNKLKEYLMNNILVVKDLNSAIEISKMPHNRYRLITLDGTQINPYGVMTGGKSTKKGKKEELKELEDLLNIDNRKLKELEDQTIKLKNTLDKVSEELIKINSDVLSNVDKIKDINGEIESLLKEIELLNNNVSKDEVSKYDDKLKELVIKDNQLKNEKLIIYKNLDKLKISLEDLDSKRRSGELELNQLNNKINSLNLDINSCNIRLDNNLQELNSTYHLSYESARENYPLDIEVLQAASRIKTLKYDIQELGMVNIYAIEEFNRVNERYQFLEQQETDLLQSKESLNELIRELDEYVEKTFKEFFDKVNINFKKIFIDLFNGGDASLVLTDENDILNSGVELFACPPSKKLKSISLLSGGEKTLTAISLLFAILSVNNSSFCIFDEVEAPLDEDNVLKFGEYLKCFKDTQFIIVTHKKETMEYANNLYGITMEEEGISKVISLHLNKGE